MAKNPFVSSGVAPTSLPTGPFPGYASDPQLEMLWSQPPPLTGLPASGTSTKSPPPSAPFAVDLGSLQNTQQDMLESASNIVSTYNDLEQQVQSVINNDAFWGQQAQQEGYRNVGTLPIAPDTYLAKIAKSYSEGINPIMTQALRSVADGMETIGIFIAMLNHAGQAYTTGDKHSRLDSDSSS